MLTSKQFYFTLFIFSVSIRIQKMPSLMAGEIGKESYILILFYFIFDLIGILLAFFILKHIKFADFENISIFKRILKSVILILCSIYFMFQCTLLYESMQDLFAHILFDSLPWTLFSLLLIFCLGFIAFKGLKCVGRLIEIFFFIIIVSYVFMAIFGGMHADFTEILPFETINFSEISKYMLPFNLWFGDFFLVLFLGMKSDKIKLGKTILIYALVIIIVSLLNLEFYGIYSIYAPIQGSLISTISEMSMLGIDIGRVDWFLILFAEMGTIVCSAMCLCLAKQSLCEAFPKIKPIFLLLALLIALYLSDVLILVDTNIKEKVFFNFASGYAAGVKLGVFVIAFIFAIIQVFKNHSKKHQNIPHLNHCLTKIKYKKFGIQNLIKEDFKLNKSKKIAKKVQKSEKIYIFSEVNADE